MTVSYTHLEHPLSQPILNEDGTSVINGYGIATPRMDVSLKSANENIFSRIISGFGGVELYGNASFSVYQDLYGEGIFAGKGVINIDLFRKVLTDTFPDNRILSHDILEGNFIRCVYVSDIAFNDNTPKNIISYAERNHRWIRGDIQNLSYIGKKIKTKNGYKKNPFNVISKYKLFDNLRRSLTLPSVFVLFLSAVFFGANALLISLLALFTGVIVSILNRVVGFDFSKRCV